MRLLLKFLKRKLEIGRVKNVHVEYVKLSFNMYGLFERTEYILLTSFTFSFTFCYAFYGDGGLSILTSVS